MPNSAHIPTAAFRPAIVAPTYNNEQTLLEVLNRLEFTGLSIFVVDDGSTDHTAAILNAWQHSRHNRYVLTHRNNAGKASALQTGFDAAREAGFSHAISIDTDGQLAPEDLPQLMAAAAADAGSLVLGARDEFAAGYPARSRVGRRVSNFLVRWECGQRVADSQCGLRIYPLDLVGVVQCRAGHFGFETEIIVRASWAGAPVISVPVTCQYFAMSWRVSHFRPWRDSFRAVVMHLRLLFDAMSDRSRRAERPRSDVECAMRPLLPMRGAAE